MAEFDKGNTIRGWERNLGNPKSALKQIGAMMVAESQASFIEQRFGKRTWPPRSDINVFGIIADFAKGATAPPERRFATRPALQDTGRLAQSISFHLDSDISVVVGSNLPYSGVHHHGGRTQSEKITESIQKKLSRWLRKQNQKIRERLGFLLTPSMIGEELTMEVPARPFLGLTKETVRDIKKTIGVEVFTK